MFTSTSGWVLIISGSKSSSQSTRRPAKLSLNRQLLKLLTISLTREWLPSLASARRASCCKCFSRLLEVRSSRLAPTSAAFGCSLPLFFMNRKAILFSGDVLSPPFAVLWLTFLQIFSTVADNGDVAVTDVIKRSKPQENAVWDSMAARRASNSCWELAPSSRLSIAATTASVEGCDPAPTSAATAFLTWRKAFIFSGWLKRITVLTSSNWRRTHTTCSWFNGGMAPLETRLVKSKVGRSDDWKSLVSIIDGSGSFSCMISVKCNPPVAPSCHCTWKPKMISNYSHYNVTTIIKID